MLKLPCKQSIIFIIMIWATIFSDYCLKLNLLVSCDICACDDMEYAVISHKQLKKADKMSFISIIRATVENDTTWKLSQNWKPKQMSENVCNSWSKEHLRYYLWYMHDCVAEMLSLVTRNIDTVKYWVQLPVWKKNT